MNTPLDSRRLMLLVAITLSGLIGCGGGSGGGGGGGGASQLAVTQSSIAPLPASSQASSSSVASANFTANAQLLGVTAAASGELYVDPQFTFDSTKELELRILARDDQGLPLAGKRVDIYAAPAELDSLQSDEAQNLALLATGFTDTAGELYRRLEVPVTLSKIKLQLDAIGIETQALITLDQTRIDYQF